MKAPGLFEIIFILSSAQTSSLALAVTTVADLLLARQRGVCLRPSVLPSVRLAGAVCCTRNEEREDCFFAEPVLCERKKPERDEETVERRTACASGSSGTYT